MPILLLLFAACWLQARRGFRESPWTWHALCIVRGWECYPGVRDMSCPCSTTTLLYYWLAQALPLSA